MTIYDETIPAAVEGTETAAAVLAGMQLGVPRPLEHSEDGSPLVGVLVPRGADFRTVDLRPLIDAHADHPRRKTGTFTVYDAVSFTSYLDKHGLSTSEVWADPDGCTLTGVIDAHHDHEIPAPGGSPVGPGLAGHGEHRVVLRLVKSHEWKAWLEHDGKMMPRDDFAEFIEQNAVDVIDPDPATMLEIAQGIHATMSSEFKNAQRLTSGEVTLQYEETINASAGHKGELEIPARFTIQIPVFVGSAPVAIDVRFRYRLRAGNLTVGYKLERPHDVIQRAFNDTAETIEQSIVQPVFLGVTG